MIEQWHSPPSPTDRVRAWLLQASAWGVNWTFLPMIRDLVEHADRMERALKEKSFRR